MSVFFRTCLSIVITVAFMTGSISAAYGDSLRTTFDVERPDLAYGSSVDYLIYRNGKRVGEHRMEFARSDGVLTVAVRSNIVVTFLKVPVFKLLYQSQEQWVQGRLQSVDVQTTQNKKISKVSLKSEGDIQTLTDVDGKVSSASVNLVSNHWHPGVVSGSKLFNTLTGRVSNYRLTEQGTSIVEVADTQISATHYRYSGDLDNDVWYDNFGRWIKMRFAADDGSMIEYRLVRPFKD